MHQRIQLREWIEDRHLDQTIRRTDTPYFEHLRAVAEQVSEAGPLAYEIGLCHDVLEETATTPDELYQALIGFGYSETGAKHITAGVVELTDQFTRQAYPELSKKSRKAKEAERLKNISPDAQTVKYADLMDNSRWMLNYDLQHAQAYLQKKLSLLQAMNKGDATVRAQAIALFSEALVKLIS